MSHDASPRALQKREIPPVKRLALACFVLTLLVPSSALACEPVMALTILFGVPVFSLYGIILIKALIFAWMERSSGLLKSFLAMIAANILSSLIGLVPLLLAVAPSSIIFGFGLVFLISVLPARRFVAFNPWGLAKGRNPYLLAALVLILYVSTFLLFGLAQGMLDISLAGYWMVKYVYIFLGLLISIGLTTFWEEWVVASLLKKEGSFLESVLKVNLLAFLIVMGLLAARALPERLRSPNFLI